MSLYCCPDCKLIEGKVIHHPDKSITCATCGQEIQFIQEDDLDGENQIEGQFSWQQPQKKEKELD